MKFTRLDLTQEINQKTESYQFSPTLNIIIVPPKRKKPLIRSLEKLLCECDEDGASQGRQPYSLVYCLKNGDEYKASHGTRHRSTDETGHQDGQDSDGKVESDSTPSFPEGILAITGTLFHRLVFPVSLSPTPLSASDSTIMLYLDSLREEGLGKPIRKAMKELEDALKSLGDDSDENTPLGHLHAAINTLEREKKDSEEKKSRLTALSSRLHGLQEKHKKLIEKEKSLREQLSREKEIKAVEKWRRLRELEKELTARESELESFRLEKEKITEKASACREELKQKDALLNLSDSLHTLINDFENMSVALGSSNTEKEKLLDEMSEKESELANKIEMYRATFGHFADRETFESHVDAIEKELSKTRMLNDRKEIYHEAKKRRDYHRRSKFLYFIPAVFFTALLIATSVYTFYNPIAFVELIQTVLALLCIFLFYESWKYYLLQRKEMKDMRKTDEEISVFKGPIDKAKSALAILHRELGVITTTDIRSRYDEWIDTKKDLENLHRVKELHSMVKSRLDTEKGKLEKDIRTILQKCAITCGDEPITPEILAQLNQEYCRLKERQTELDTLGKQYRAISDGMIEAQEARAAVRKEIQSVKTVWDQAAESPELKSVIDVLSAHDETELAISEYEKELNEHRGLLHTLQHSGMKSIEIEEELLYDIKKQNAMKKRQSALTSAASEMGEMEHLFMDRVYTPFFTSLIKVFIDILEPLQGRAICKSLLDRLISREQLPVETDETEVTGLLSSLASLMVRYSFSSVITKDLESLPLLIDFDDLSGCSDDGHIRKALASLIELSRLTQLFFLTEDEPRGEYLQRLVVSENIPCITHKTPQLMLITAEEMIVDDDQ